jgi:hypothetical protein
MRELAMSLVVWSSSAGELTPPMVIACEAIAASAARRSSGSVMHPGHGDGDRSARFDYYVLVVLVLCTIAFYRVPCSAEYYIGGSVTPKFRVISGASLCAPPPFHMSLGS